MLVAQLAHVAQLGGRNRADAALPLDRLDQDRRGLRTDRRLQRLAVAERHLVEALHLRAEALQVFLLAAGGERRQRAAVEGALEGDDAEALRRALGEMIAPRRLDGAFHRLGAGIAEEDAVGEGRIHQPLAERPLAGNLENVGDVPELVGLRLQRVDDVRVRVAEHVHRDAAHEVQVASAVGADEPRALAALEGERRAEIGLE